MRKVMVAACAVAVALFVARPASALPTTDELLARIAEAAKKLKSYSHDVTIATLMPTGIKGLVKGTAKGVNSVEDGKPVTRSSNVAIVTFTFPNGRQVERRIREVNDGKFNWKETRSGLPGLPGQVTVVKSLAGSKDEDGIPRGVDALKEFEIIWRVVYKLQVTDEDTVDGEKVYWIEGPFNEDYPKQNLDAVHIKAKMATVRLAVSQNDLFPRRLIGLDAEGNETSIMEATNIKLNVDLDEKEFIYVPPKGAKVQDLTQDNKEPEKAEVK